MILGPHIIIATATSRYFFDNLFLVFLISIASHFLADMIPHWDYKTESIERNADASGIPLPQFKPFDLKNYSSDFFKFLIDGLSGMLIASLFLPNWNFASVMFLLTATFGGVLPDLLQGFYSTGKFNFLKPVQVFHTKSHWWRKSPFLRKCGILAEVLIVLIAILGLWLV